MKLGTSSVAEPDQLNVDLSHSESRLRELLDGVNDLVQSVAPDGTLLFANRVWYETLGYAPDEVSNLFQIIHRDSLSHCQTQFQRVLEGESLSFVEADFVAKDGRRIAVEGSANCTFKAGQPSATNAIFRDVSARKQVERERDMLRFAIDQGMEGVAQLDAQGVYIYMNPAHAAIYGYAGAELIGKTWRELHTTEQIALIEASYFPILQREGKWRGPLVARKKNGEPIHVEISLTAIRSPSGAFDGLLCTCADITQRASIERALRQSERRFRSLFNSTYQFMGLLSVDGMLWEMNDPALLIGGVTREDVIGKYLWDTRWFSISKSVRTQLRESIARASRGEFVRYDVRIQAAGERTITVDFSLNPVFDEAGRIVQIILEARDITASHDLAVRLEASERRLRTITDNIPALIGYVGRDERYQFANKAYEQWFSISRDHIIGRTSAELLGAKAYARAKPYLDRAFAGQTVSFENHRDDGRYAGMTYVPDLQGEEVKGIYVVVTDITDRVLAAQNLFAQRERARTTLGSIGDGVITINSAGKIDYLNEVAQRLTGWKFVDADGMRVETVLRLIDQSSGKPIDSPMYHALATGEPAELPPRTILISKDGSEYSVEDSCTPIRDADGNVSGAVLVFRDVTDQREMVERITYQARHDALTGLVNRHEFELSVDNQLANARSTGHHHALLFIDLDRFKIVNDSCGHPAGDELLRQVARLMSHKLRKSDLLGRLGGDEFGVLLENCRLEKAEQIAQSLVDEVAAFRFNWEDKIFSIGASIGVVPISRESKTPESLFAAADAACYWVKENGRNQVRVYHPTDSEQLDERAPDNWVERITAGLEEDRFCLYGQRITATSHARGNGADFHEVLLRLQEADGKLVSPMAFLPAAERHGLMPQIDRWVIQHTFAVMRRSVLNGHGGHLSVNLSSVSITDKTVLAFIIEQLRTTNIPPQNICFEITEAAVVGQLEEARKFITALKDLGCSVALDNVANGLSSFPYLKNYPIDYVKIDGHRIKQIASETLDYAMVDSINRMAHVLGIQTVAAAVETTAVLSKLEAIGIDHVQGYAIHEPQPIVHIF